MYCHWLQRTKFQSIKCQRIKYQRYWLMSKALNWMIWGLLMKYQKLRTYSHTTILEKYIWKNVEVPWDQISLHEISQSAQTIIHREEHWKWNICTNTSCETYGWKKTKLCVKVPQGKWYVVQICIQENNELWTYVKIYKKDIGIGVPFPIMMNYDVWHVDTDPSLMKT